MLLKSLSPGVLILSSSLWIADSCASSDLASDAERPALPLATFERARPADSPLEEPFVSDEGEPVAGGIDAGA